MRLFSKLNGRIDNQDRSVINWMLFDLILGVREPEIVYSTCSIATYTGLRTVLDGVYHKASRVLSGVFNNILSLNIKTSHSISAVTDTTIADIDGIKIETHTGIEQISDELK
jgi:hypothetical protein